MKTKRPTACWNPPSVEEGQAAITRIDGAAVDSLVRRTFPHLTLEQITVSGKAIVRTLVVALVGRESAVGMPTVADTRKNTEELRAALAAVRAALDRLDPAARRNLAIVAGEIEPDDGHHNERGDAWWSAFDSFQQDAIKWTEQALDRMPRPDPKRRPPWGFDDMVRGLAKVYLMHTPSDGRRSALRSTKRGGFVMFVHDAIGCVQGYPSASNDDIQNAVRRPGNWPPQKPRANTESS